MLSALWLLTVAGAVRKYFFQRQEWDILLALAALAFCVGLIWILGRTKPGINELPAPDIFTAKWLGFWARVLLLLVGLMLTFLLGMFISPGLSMMLVCGLLGLGVTLNWRHALTWKITAAGLAIGLISALGTIFLGTGDLLWAAAYMVTIPWAFIGGALILRRTQLGHMRILEGKFAPVLNGFVIGSVLGIPASLFNLLGNMQSQDAYIIHWWQPLYAIVPAIAEESWARLFLISFCYAVLRPVTNSRPRRAIFVAILMSILAFSTAHAGINPFVIIIDGLLFSTPYALLLIKKDFEHAVGYHFIVDLVRFIAAFLYN